MKKTCADFQNIHVPANKIRHVQILQIILLTSDANQRLSAPVSQLLDGSPAEQYICFRLLIYGEGLLILYNYVFIATNEFLIKIIH